MRTLLLILAAVSFTHAADDPWKAVKTLKSGSTVRIYPVGPAKPFAAQIMEASDDKLVYVIKNSQSSIGRNQIDRIEYRPPVKPTKTETHSTTMGADGLNDTWTSSTSWSHEGWQIIYHR